MNVEVKTRGHMGVFHLDKNYLWHSSKCCLQLFLRIKAKVGGVQWVGREGCWGTSAELGIFLHSNNAGKRTGR